MKLPKRPRNIIAALALAAAATAVACGGGGGHGSAAENDVPASSASAAASTVERRNSEFADLTGQPLTAAEQRVADRLSTSWPKTDFTQRKFSLTEILDGGPGKDGIPSLRSPQFVSQDVADQYLDPREPVIALEINGEARAYPIQILIWHEIALDELGGVPVAVTFCPLCNTAITFDRRVDGEVRDFGVSGLLRRSDLIMFDRTNESLWQQITGEAFVGQDSGKRLDFIPSQIVSWEAFRASFPEALVLSRDTGFSRNYGVNPYQGYDRIGSGTLFPHGNEDERLEGKERVLTVEVGGQPVAFPFVELSDHPVLTYGAGEDEVVAFWTGDTFSALDDLLIVGSRNVGSAGAFRPFLDGERLEFEARDGQIVDTKTGSVWNVLGRAISGEMEGAQLEPVVAANHFWFAWAVFQPDTHIVRTG